MAEDTGTPYNTLMLAIMTLALDLAPFVAAAAAAAKPPHIVLIVSDGE